MWSLLESKILLISYEPEVERVCAAAMRSCYSQHNAFSIFSFNALNSDLHNLEGERPFDDARISQLLRKALELGHHDILEHGSFTFDIQGISRACSHQLVRHRLASFSQQSQRYVKITRTNGFVRPPSIPTELSMPIEIAGSTVNLSFADILDICRQAEEAFLSKGIKAEDARYVRPNASATNIVASMNPRQLLHIFELRCAQDSQWEIRDLSWSMYAAARLVAPTIFETLGGAKGSEYMQSKVSKIGAILEICRSEFEDASPGSLYEIPLDQLDLEYEIRVYVRKLNSQRQFTLLPAA